MNNKCNSANQIISFIDLLAVQTSHCGSCGFSPDFQIVFSDADSSCFIVHLNKKDIFAIYFCYTFTSTPAINKHCD